MLEIKRENFYTFKLSQKSVITVVSSVNLKHIRFVVRPTSRPVVKVRGPGGGGLSHLLPFEPPAIV